MAGKLDKNNLLGGQFCNMFALKKQENNELGGQLSNLSTLNSNKVFSLESLRNVATQYYHCR